MIFLLIFYLSPVKIHIQGKQDIQRLKAEGIPIEGLRGDTVFSHIDRLKEDRIKDMGLTYEFYKVLPKAGYHSYEALKAKLDSITQEYPNITKLISIGKSVQNRDIWALKISDNPDVNEIEPEVRIVSTIHGDEPPGTELILRMIDSLCTSYNHDPRITNLINNREIWFIPLFNPDGYTLHQRYNADNMDLNRNFPVPDGSIGDDGTYSYEPETQAMLDFSDTMNFALSCMYHTGSMVVNYAYDYTPDSVPDQDLVYDIALGYARLNARMYNSTEFDSGVTNGYAWYQVKGSLQDWAYHYTNCIDLTIELWTTKWPDTTVLDTIWDENKNSILYLIERSGYGIFGRIFSIDGIPLAGKVQIPGNTQIEHSDSTTGEYHRLLLPGNHTLIYSADDYKSETLSVYFPGDTSIYQDVYLKPTLSEISGIVKDSISSLPDVSVLVDTSYIIIDSTKTDSAGKYSISIPTGRYNIQFKKPGYRPIKLDSVWVQGSVILNETMSPYLIFAYPNPFFTTTHILIYPIKKEEVNIAIFNLLGQKVYEEKIPAGCTGLQDISFPAKDIPEGNYFLRCQTYSGLQLYLKLIKL